MTTTTPDPPTPRLDQAVAAHYGPNAEAGIDRSTPVAAAVADHYAPATEVTP